jgi:hypothetical protein
VADIFQIAQQYRTALLVRDQAAAGRLITAYGQAWIRLQDSLAILSHQIEVARARGEQITSAWLHRQERFRALLAQTSQESLQLSNFAEGLITAGQRIELERAARDALGLIVKSASDAGIMTSFNQLPKGAVEQIVGTLGDGCKVAEVAGGGKGYG